MVMAPSGNLGGDNPFYPLQASGFSKVTFVGTRALNSASMTTILSTPTLPPGQYLCIGILNCSDVTAADEVIAKIQNANAPFSAQVTAASQVAVGLSVSVTVIGVIILTHSDIITLSAQAGATNNLTVNATDPSTNNFQATSLLVIPWQ